MEDYIDNIREILIIGKNPESTISIQLKDLPDKYHIVEQEIFNEHLHLIEKLGYTEAVQILVEKLHILWKLIRRRIQ
jgi:hypothetical protein